MAYSWSGNSLTTGLGEILSDLIEPVSRSRKQQREPQSTEEVLRKIQDTNQRLMEEKIKNVAIGSLDVEALYP